MFALTYTEPRVHASNASFDIFIYHAVMDLPLGHMRALHAVSATGGVTRAAERLGMTQPAVSRQLRQLERATGVKLVERDGRRIRLTAGGQLLGEYARRIFQLVDEAKVALADAQHLRRGRLAVAASTTVGVYLLPEALVRFRQRFPGIELALEVGDARSARDRLRSGEAELALTETFIAGHEFDSRVFATDELVGIVPRGHSFARRKAVSAATLAREPFVVREPGSHTRSLVERVLAERGLHVDPVISLSSTEAVKRAVAAGLGVSIVARMSVGAEVAAGKLAALRLSDVLLRRPVYETRLSNREQTKASVAFLCLVKHVVRGTLPKLGAKRLAARG